MIMNRKYLLPSLVVFLLLSLSCSLFTPTATRPDSADTPPPEAIAESAPSNGSSDNPCNNVFYPLIPGQQLIYKIDSPEEGEDQIGITVASVDGSTATLDMLVLSTGIISQSTIECEDGAIKEYPLATMDTLFGDMVEGTLRNEYVSGVIAPSEETLIANNWDMSWESQYIKNGEITFSEGAETITVLINDSPVVMTWKVDSTGQSLSVPAGTFNNVVIVTREMTSVVSMDMDGTVVETTILFKSTHWFEPYIGMLKMNMDSATVQIQEITFPIDLGETMELIEFRPAE